MKYNPKATAHATQLARDLAWALEFLFKERPGAFPWEVENTTSLSNDFIRVVGRVDSSSTRHGHKWGLTLQDHRPEWTSGYGLGEVGTHGNGEVYKIDRVGIFLTPDQLARLAVVNESWEGKLTGMLHAGAYRNTLDDSSSKETCRLLRLFILTVSQKFPSLMETARADWATREGGDAPST
jgi:hypothetical protein